MGKAWSKDEEATLRKCIKTGIPVKIIHQEYLPTRSPNAINDHRYVLGLTYARHGIKRDVFTVSVDSQLGDIIKECAEAHRISYSRFIAHILAEALAS